jgi:hypothetical protein
MTLPIGLHGLDGVMTNPKWKLAACVALVASTFGCSKQIFLRRSAVDLGAVQQSPGFVCQLGAVQCEKGTKIQPADWNQSNTSKVPLPDCAEGIHRISVAWTDKSPEVWVQCATAAGSASCSAGQEPRPLAEQYALKDLTRPQPAVTHFICQPGAEACEVASAPECQAPLDPKRVVPLYACPYGIGQILVQKAKKKPVVTVQCLDHTDDDGDDDHNGDDGDRCPEGQERTMDLENGGFKCAPIEGEDDA